jgi:hypothetical protein
MLNVVTTIQPELRERGTTSIRFNTCFSGLLIAFAIASGRDKASC